MAYDIFLERNGRILRVRYSGRVDIEERKAAAENVLGRAAHDGISRFLLDYRQATCRIGDEPSSQALAQYLAGKLGNRKARVAWLVTHDHQLSASVEDLTRSYGVANQRFNDLDAALAWLEQPDEPEPAAVPLRPALALAMEASDPQVPMPPVQFAAIVQLVQELLDAGIEQPVALRLASRMFEVVKSVR